MKIFVARVKILIVCFVLIFISLYCAKENFGSGLTVRETFSLDIDETSGLAVGTGDDILYTVSDDSNKIYKITTSGKTLSSLLYVGTDLEGVAFDGNNNCLWVVEERTRTIIQLDLQGNKKRVISVPVEVKLENSGLEGISINPVNGNVFVLNESNPAQLIELNSSGLVLNKIDLHFALDYSGICINPDGTEMWLVSDESSSVYRCNMDAEVLAEYKIGYNSAEGIAIDFSKGKLYIVSDDQGRLYCYDLPDVEE